MSICYGISLDDIFFLRSLINSFVRTYNSFSVNSPLKTLVDTFLDLFLTSLKYEVAWKIVLLFYPNVGWLKEFGNLLLIFLLLKYVCGKPESFLSFSLELGSLTLTVRSKDYMRLYAVWYSYLLLFSFIFRLSWEFSNWLALQELVRSP